MLSRMSVTRRDFLRASGLVGGTLFIGSSLWRSGRLLAQVQTSAPPTVDRLAVRVVVDSYQDGLARSARVGNIEVERVSGAGLKKRIYGEFGLSLHLESQRGEEKRNIMLDFGYTPGALFNNLDILKIDTALLDALILSHGHYDHFGGMVPFLQRERAKMRKDLPLYVGGEDTFCYRRGGQENYVLDRRELAAANVQVIMAEKPAVIEGHAFTTGSVPKKSFEKRFSASQSDGRRSGIEIGVRDGAGCDASHFSKEEQEGKIVPDQFKGEHATCFNVKSRGLVVMSSCGHAGIVNSIRQAQAVSGVEKVHAVIGGFHLSPTPEPYVAQVVKALKEINPDCVIPMHCSGQTFIQMVQREMPDKLILSYTGSRYIFGV
jgi:7,8-dihydropterin-6-yl-methyl-4-(beta-D-ribofuranosyl)aminobenzene 5'-phosphate synthase